MNISIDLIAVTNLPYCKVQILGRAIKVIVISV